MTATAPTAGCISAMFRTTPAPKDPVVQIVGLNAVTMDGQPKRIKCVRPRAPPAQWRRKADRVRASPARDEQGTDRGR